MACRTWLLHTARAWFILWMRAAVTSDVRVLGRPQREWAVLFIGMAMNHVQEDLLSKIGSKIFLCHQQDGDPATT